MIFGTVGGQMPFDRMIRAIDDWAYERGRDDVILQVGPSDIELRAAKGVQFLSPEEYQSTFDQAQAVVAHAGMGSILTALTCGKPLLVLPRKGALMETRNDHQIATAKHFSNRAGLLVAMEEDELADKLDELTTLAPPERIRDDAEGSLIEALRNFVHQPSSSGTRRSPQP